MQAKRSGSTIGLLGALIAGLIAVGSAYVSWLLIDETHLGWVFSRGISFAVLIVGVLVVLIIFGGLELPKETKNP
jgi:hypothetical protein